MPELLTCEVCHGQVASDAVCCPHCGSHHYVRRVSLYDMRQQKLRQERQEYLVKKYGSVLLELLGRSEWPRITEIGSDYTLSIDGMMCFRLTTYHSCLPHEGEMVEEQSRRIGDSDDYKRIFFIRVHPGAHTLTLTCRKKVSSLTFSCDEHSRYITIEICKTGILSEHFKLKSVTVE